MPGGRGKPRRACGLCKMYKYLGNGKHRRTHGEQVQLDATDEAIEEALSEIVQIGERMVAKVEQRWP